MRTLLAVFLGLSIVPPALAAPSVPKPSSTEQAAIFKAAGFVKKGATWRSGCGLEDPSASYSPGSIAEYRDINGDGRPDALVTEGGTFCYGHTGTGYWLLSRQANGGWKLMNANQGIAGFLKAKGVGGWPDIEVGGPGFCFPVLRWNGSAYRFNRHQYEGKACRPPR